MNDNVAIIINSNGEKCYLKEKKDEDFHYQAFERINKEIIPGIIDDLIIDPRAYSGYNLAIITAAKKYAIIMRLILKNTNDLILAVPSEITQEQHDAINELLKTLKNNAIYLYVCEKIDNLDYIFVTPKTS